MTTRTTLPRYTGLCLTIPDGVIMEDRLTGLDVVRKRTERTPAMQSRLQRMPTPA